MTTQCDPTATYDVLTNTHTVRCNTHPGDCPTIPPNAVPVTNTTGLTTTLIGYIVPASQMGTFGGRDSAKVTVYEAYLANGVPLEKWDGILGVGVPWSNRHAGAEAAKAALRKHVEQPNT